MSLQAIGSCYFVELFANLGSLPLIEPNLPDEEILFPFLLLLNTCRIAEPSLAT